MTLGEYIQSQGVPFEDALDLIGRKLATPHLMGCTYKGRYISLDMSKDTSRVNDMLRSGRAPQSVSDVEFLKGQDTGKKYLPQFARFPGDPRAVVSSRGEVQKMCEQEGRGCDGLVKVKERPREEAPQSPCEGVDVADHVLNALVRKEFAGQTVTVKEVKRKREEIRQRVKPPWKKPKGSY